MHPVTSAILVVFACHAVAIPLNTTDIVTPHYKTVIWEEPSNQTTNETLVIVHAPEEPNATRDVIVHDVMPCHNESGAEYAVTKTRHILWFIEEKHANHTTEVPTSTVNATLSTASTHGEVDYRREQDIKNFTVSPSTELPTRKFVLRDVGGQSSTTATSNQSTRALNNNYNACEHNGLLTIIAEASRKLVTDGVDPLAYTVRYFHSWSYWSFDCHLIGFSNVVLEHHNCSNDGSHATFFGDFVFPRIDAVCDCGHKMTRFQWMVNMSIANTDLDAEIKKKDGKPEAFYNKQTYTAYSEVAAPIGNVDEIHKFIQEFHAKTREVFNGAYIKASDKILKQIAKYL